MHTAGQDRIGRRQFVKAAGLAASLGIAGGAQQGVSIVADPADAVAADAASRWAAKELADSLVSHGIAVRNCERLAQVPAGDLCIVAAGLAAQVAAGVVKSAGVRVAAVAESLVLAPGKAGGRGVLLAGGHDARGLVYALLDLADRVQTALDAAGALAALAIQKAVAETPANAIRGVNRLFTSDVEDKPWYNDSEMWPHYLTMLATQRFNRFQPELRHRLRFSAQRDRRVLSVCLSVSDVRAGVPRAGSATAGRRARPQSSNPEIYQRADGGPRHAVPVGHLDARL